MKKYLNDMKNDLKQLISIASVEGEPKPNMPFGEECFKALDFTLSRAKALGFETKNVDGYAGHLIFGSGEPIAVLTHLDVVPAGENWTMPPFEGIEKDGKIYGRGAVDNKGSTVACLYALKALKDSGKKFKKSVKMIMGCNEETGWRCMDYYVAHEQMPKIGFSPDADFPVIYAEKGVLHLHVDVQTSQQFNEHIFSLSAGSRQNMVPAFCECILNDKITSVPNSVNLVKNDKFTTLTTDGKTAHGSTPHLGKNAIKPMIDFLAEKMPDDLLTFLSDKLLKDNSGKALGIDCSDEQSGALTINIGVIKYSKGALSMEVDIRYPVTHTLEHTLEKFKAACPNNFETKVILNHNPLLVEKDDELVTKLMSAYKEVTGRDEQPVAIGGGTYARVLSHGVAFGPMLSEQPDVVHQADEYIDTDHLLLITEIYKLAIEKLIS